MNVEKQNAEDVEQSSSTEPENREKKPQILLVAEILQYFVEEKLSPNEILLVLREVENEAMTAYIAERLSQSDNS